MYIDIGVFYKLRDKERSKESAYVLVGFLARPFVSFVSHIVNWQKFISKKSKINSTWFLEHLFFTKLLADSNKW